MATCKWSIPRRFACISTPPTSRRGPGRSADRRWERRCKPGHGALARRTAPKIHARVDANGLPIRLKLTEGQARDGHRAADMVETVEAGQILLADRAYDSDALRQTLAARSAWANVKPTSRRREKSACSAFLYRYRNLVERFFSKLKHFRAVDKRLEKHDANYLALVKLASAKIWMRLVS